MRRVEPIKVVVFAIVLVCIAGFINSARTYRLPAPMIALQSPPVRQYPVPSSVTSQPSAQSKAQEQANYRARYVDASLSRISGRQMLALVAVSENGKLDRFLNLELARHFKSGSVEIYSSLFKPGFVSDGLFESVFNGSNEPIRKLQLADTLDAILLARETVEYSSNPSLDNVLTANMRLEIVLVPMSANFQSQAWTFTANGAGFHQSDARAMAEERLIKQISNDTKMSLNQ